MTIRHKTGTSNTGTDWIKIKYWAKPPYWLDIRQGRYILCRKSHPELPDDEHVDYIDCEWAFEKKP